MLGTRYTMGMKQPILAWANSYGAWAPDVRHPLEVIGHNDYLNGLADAVSILKSRVSLLYVSGGQRDVKGLSECDTVIPELNRRLERRVVRSVRIISDDESQDGIAVINTFLAVWQADYARHQPLLFTDEARYAVNAYLLDFLAKKMGFELQPEHVLVPIRRLDIHPSSSPAYQAHKLVRLKREGLENYKSPDCSGLLYRWFISQR